MVRELNPFVRWADGQRATAVGAMGVVTPRRKKGHYRGVRSDIQGLENWKVDSSSPDEDLIPDLETLRARSRDCERNEPLCSGALDTSTVNVIGLGLRLKSRPDHEILGISEDEANAVGRKIERYFEYWVDEADYSGMLTFSQLQAMAFHSALMNGDVLAIFPYEKSPDSIFGTRVQMLEGDLVRNPGEGTAEPARRAGVELLNGRPVGYHVAPDYPGAGSQKADDWKYYPRFSKSGRTVAALMANIKRPGSVRGVPYFASVMERIKNLGDFTTAEVKTAMLNTLFSLVRTHNLDYANQEAEDLELDPEGTRVQKFEFGNGMVHHLDPGEDIKSITAGHPNKDFGPFLDTLYKTLGAGINLPKSMVAHAFENSYSSARADLLMAYQHFRARRAWAARQFCRPAFFNVLDEMVSMGLIEAPGYFDDPLVRAAYRSSKWVGQRMPQIDPLKEANAARVRLETNMTSLDEEIAEYNGGTFEETYQRQRNERQKLAELPALSKGALVVEKEKDDDDA